MASLPFVCGVYVLSCRKDSHPATAFVIAVWCIKNPRHSRLRSAGEKLYPFTREGGFRLDDDLAVEAQGQAVQDHCDNPDDDYGHGQANQVLRRHTGGVQGVGHTATEHVGEAAALTAVEQHEQHCNHAGDGNNDHEYVHDDVHGDLPVVILRAGSAAFALQTDGLTIRYRRRPVTLIRFLGGAVSAALVLAGGQLQGRGPVGEHALGGELIAFSVVGAHVPAVDEVVGELLRGRPVGASSGVEALVYPVAQGEGHGNFGRGGAAVEPIKEFVSAALEVLVFGRGLPVLFAARVAEVAAVIAGQARGADPAVADVEEEHRADEACDDEGESEAEHAVKCTGRTVRRARSGWVLRRGANTPGILPAGRA